MVAPPWWLHGGTRTALATSLETEIEVAKPKLSNEIEIEVVKHVCVPMVQLVEFVFVILAA